MNLAILGATSHIAKGLIQRFLAHPQHHLQLFSRNPDQVELFLDAIGQSGSPHCSIRSDYSRLTSLSCESIINCIGVETRNKLDCDFTRYFTVTEEFDNLVLSYLKTVNRNTLYLSFSSGAVYGNGFFDPAGDFTTNPIQVNHVKPEDYYGLVRLNAEAKHRVHSDLRIIDLRIFSYFSRFINLKDGYFITDVLEAIKNDRVLVTDDNNIVRDYLHPDDLFSMISSCLRVRELNTAIDVSSLQPVSKLEILDFFASTHRLRYEMRPTLLNSSATGAKKNYYSTQDTSASIGYRPQFTSMDTIRQESKYLLATDDQGQMSRSNSATTGVFSGKRCD